MSISAPPQGNPAGSPVPALRQMIWGARMTRALYVVAKLRIPDLLAEHPRTATELAEQASVDASLLNRILRLLASLGVFTESEPGTYALTPLSSLLQSEVDGSLRPALLFEEELNGRAWGELLATTQAQVPWERAYGCSIYEYLARHPAAAELYNAAVKGRTRVEHASELLALCDFSRIGSLVDVGGGSGVFLAALLAGNPALHGVLFDRAKVMEDEARPLIEKAGLSDRCEFVTGDFFQSVPAGGDAYVLKCVLRTFSDVQARTILVNCRQAMRGRGRLLVIESIVAAQQNPSCLFFADVGLYVNFGGLERTEGEFRTLLADGGFETTRVLYPARGDLGVIESVPRA